MKTQHAQVKSIKQTNQITDWQWKQEKEKDKKEMREIRRKRKDKAYRCGMLA